MRRRIGGSLFSLALILYLVGISFQEDFWTKAPGDQSPLQQSQDKSSDSAENYNHDNPRVSPIDLAKRKQEKIDVEPAQERALQPSFIHENGLSLVMIQDQEQSNANIHFVTYNPDEHAVYVSSMQDYKATEKTEAMVQQLESEYHYPLDYYIRIDKDSLKSVTEEVLDNAFVQQTLEDQGEGMLNDSGESMNLGTLVKDMSQLSFGTLMSLNKLVSSLSQEVETNLSVGEILTLRGKYGMEAFLEPLEVKRGLQFEDSVPVMKNESRSVAEMLGSL